MWQHSPTAAVHPLLCCCSCRLAHANLGVGLASAAGLLALADKASLATAFLSFSCGLSGELLVSWKPYDMLPGASSSCSCVQFVLQRR